MLAEEARFPSPQSSKYLGMKTCEDGLEQFAGVWDVRVGVLVFLFFGCLTLCLAIELRGSERGRLNLQGC